MQIDQMTEGTPNLTHCTEVKKKRKPRNPGIKVTGNSNFCAAERLAWLYVGGYASGQCNGRRCKTIPRRQSA